MPAIPLIVSAAVSVGTAAVAANQAKKAAQASASAQKTALENVKGVDIPGISAQAKEADLQKYKDQFKHLAEIDPATGKMRDQANAGLSENVNDANTQRQNTILKSLFDENITLSPTDKAFAENLKAEAARQLALGGDFSPEQQAELVRAGLETGAQGGFNAGSSALRQGVGKLLASEKESLGERRRLMAQNLFGFATDLQAKRNAGLTGIAGASGDASSSAFSKLFNLANLADSRVPDIGLSGSDVANLAVGNNNLDNQKQLGLGTVASDLAVSKGAAGATLTGAIGSSIGTLAGGLLSKYKVGGTGSKLGKNAFAAGGRI